MPRQKPLHLPTAEANFELCCKIWTRMLGMVGLRKRHTAILGDTQKTRDIHTNIYIIKKKKIKNNNHSHFYMDMKKLN